MTQRIFDVENKKDMQDLWDILPDAVEKLSSVMGIRVRISTNTGCSTETNLFAIKWHDKTEITRPIQGAIEQDIGKLCKFWDDNSHYYYGILEKIGSHSSCYYNQNNIDFEHCRRLTKQEIEELI